MRIPLGVYHLLAIASVCHSLAFTRSLDTNVSALVGYESVEETSVNRLIHRDTDGDLQHLDFWVFLKLGFDHFRWDLPPQYHDAVLLRAWISIGPGQDRYHRIIYGGGFVFNWHGRQLRLSNPPKGVNHLQAWKDIRIIDAGAFPPGQKSPVLEPLSFNRIHRSDPDDPTKGTLQSYVDQYERQTRMMFPRHLFINILQYGNSPPPSKTSLANKLVMEIDTNNFAIEIPSGEVIRLPRRANF